MGSLGCPEVCDPSCTPEVSEKEKANASFREACMHGSLGPVQEFSKTADVHAVEASTGRSGLHKAVFWGHIDTVKFLVNDLKLDVNTVDNEGDSALHDAVVKFLLSVNADVSIKNKNQMTAADVAKQY